MNEITPVKISEHFITVTDSRIVGRKNSKNNRDNPIILTTQSNFFIYS